jgi:hypothetical protein
MANGYSNTNRNNTGGAPGGTSGNNTQGQNQNGGMGRNGNQSGKDIFRFGNVTFEEDAPLLDEDVITEDEIEDEVIIPVGDINFQKTIYSQKAFRKKVDTSISELRPKQRQVDIPSFFRHYNRVFFDIPKEGQESHTTIIEASKDFINNYVDPKDATISSLEEQIRDLEYELINPNKVKEHPIFTNGTLIKIKDESHTVHYMDQGYRRRVDWNDDMIRAIKIAKTGTDEGPTYIEISRLAMEAIPQGYPSLNENNYSVPFDPSLSEIRGRLSSLQWTYDRNGTPDIDPENYTTQATYLEALSEDIGQKATVLNKIGQTMAELRKKIQTLKNLDPDYYALTYGGTDLDEFNILDDEELLPSNAAADRSGTGGSGGGRNY